MSRDLVSDAMPLVHHYLDYHAKDFGAVSCGIVTSDSRAHIMGVRGIDSHDRPDEESSLSIGSITKGFTAVEVLQLVASKKLRLNDPIEKYIDPPKGRPKVYEKIRVRDLLTHTSGLSRQGGFFLGEGSSWEDVNYSDADPVKAYKCLSDKDFLPPGQEFNYSNFGYQLLGKIVEVVSGMLYADLLKKKILDPLGMNNTLSTNGWRDLPTDSLIPGFKYRDSDGKREPLPLIDPLARAMPKATDIFSTAADMCRFIEFLLRGNPEVLPDYYRRSMLDSHWLWNAQHMSQSPENQRPEVLANPWLNNPPEWLNNPSQRPKPPSPYVGLHAGETPRRSLGFDILDNNREAFVAGHMWGYRCSLVVDIENGTGTILMGNAMDAPVVLDTAKEILNTLRTLKTASFGNAALRAPGNQLSGVFDGRSGRIALIRIGDGVVLQYMNGNKILAENPATLWWDGDKLRINEGPWGSRHEILEYKIRPSLPLAVREDFGWLQSQGAVDAPLDRVWSAPPQALQIRVPAGSTKPTRTSTLESRVYASLPPGKSMAELIAALPPLTPVYNRSRPSDGLTSAVPASSDTPAGSFSAVRSPGTLGRSTAELRDPLFQGWCPEAPYGAPRPRNSSR